MRQPVDYLRAEIDRVVGARSDAQRRKNALESMARRAGLPDASIERHRDVLEAQIAQAEMFLALLRPFAEALESAKGNVSAAARRAGWAFDTLIPYLLRDWTGTDEFAAAKSVIVDALEEFVPHRDGKAIAFAGCGAAGLLGEIAPGFATILGFDLTLPILSAARHLLEGETLTMAMPRAVCAQGAITLRGRKTAHVELAAMDAFDMAFADTSIDCVVTTFLLDLVPNPRALAAEIRRVLAKDGVWINYGPSGPLNGLWRFDEDECTGFLESAGFEVLKAQARRATYLDLSRDCPGWGFQSHMCYLACARKAVSQEKKTAAPPREFFVGPETVPEHFPGATLVRRQRLATGAKESVLLRHERIPGRAETFDIGDEEAKHLLLVDGKRTIAEISRLLHGEEPAPEKILTAFNRYFTQGLLSRHREGSAP